MEKPKYTIVYNSLSEDGYIGVCWEFFTDENKAKARYDFLSSDSVNYCPTKRPYYHDTDKHHLGACHSDIRNSPNIFKTKTKMEKQEFIKKYRGSYPDVTGRTKWKNWDDVEKEMDTDLENIFADRLSFMQKDLDGWQKENVKLKLEIGKLITDAGYLKNKK